MGSEAMTDEKTRALIAEAEKHIASTLSSIGAESSSVRAAWARGEGADERFALVVKLTAALSALTVPDGDARPEMSESSVVAYHQWRKNLGWERLSDDEGTAARIAFYAGWDWARAAAPEPSAQDPLDPYLTPDEVKELPVGSVVMTETDPETFGVYEQRVWQRFGGEPDWQFKIPRHEWQSTDGGFQSVSHRDWPPVFANNRRVRLLYAPGPLPVGGETDGE